MMTDRTETSTIDQSLDPPPLPRAMVSHGMGGALFREVDHQGSAAALGLLAKPLKRLLGACTAEHGITPLRKLSRYLSTDTGRGPRDQCLSIPFSVHQTVLYMQDNETIPSIKSHYHWGGVSA